MTVRQLACRLSAWAALHNLELPEVALDRQVAYAVGKHGYVALGEHVGGWAMKLLSDGSIMLEQLDDSLEVYYTQQVRDASQAVTVLLAAPWYSLVPQSTLEVVGRPHLYLVSENVVLGTAEK